MALSAAQIITLSCQNAGVPGFTAQALQYLNSILQDFCQGFDITAAQKDFNFTMPTAVNAIGQATLNFPSDYLRAKPDDCFYLIQGVPYKLIPQDLSEMDSMVTTAGFNAFPQSFAVDTSKTPPLAYFWPPPSGAYQSVVRYQALMPDITDTSVTPWFPNQMYLITRLTGELCKLADDDRYISLLGSADNPAAGSAYAMLSQFMKMTGDRENRAQTVKLDRRRFGTSFDRLKNTKQVGW